MKLRHCRGVLTRSLLHLISPRLLLLVHPLHRLDLDLLLRDTSCVDGLLLCYGGF